MKLSINTGSNYDVIVDYSILQSLGSHLKSFNKNQLFILCFSSNLESQSQKLYRHLKDSNYNIESLEICDGEKKKDIDSVKHIIQELVNLGSQNTRSWSFLHDRIQQLDSIISTRNDVETFFDLMVLSEQKAFQFP